MPTAEDIQHQYKLLEIYRRNVGHYLEQAGAHGGEVFAPPVVRSGLREAREQIASIKLNLRNWSQNVEDLPTDSAKVVPPSPPPLPPDDALDYVLEEQPWYTGRPPDTSRIRRTEAEALVGSVPILLLTVNDNEFFAVGKLLSPLPEHDRVLQLAIGQETYYLGQYGVYNAVLAKSRMGSAGLGASMLVTQAAQDFWKPRATIAVGVAFGMNRNKQQLGDVLVASEIIPYNAIRAGATLVERGQRVPCDATLFNRFDNTYDWDFRRPDGKHCRVHKGTLLSGEELVDNPDRKAELLQRFPEAIGGEMEGTGLSSASFYERRPWILIKAICDWADGTKNSQHQPFAAAAAASLVHHVLSDPDALDGV